MMISPVVGSMSRLTCSDQRGFAGTGKSHDDLNSPCRYVQIHIGQQAHDRAYQANLFEICF